MKTLQETKQSKLPEKLLKNSKKVVERNEKGQLKKGVILNPEGRPLGSKNFNTLMDETVKEIAKLNNISISEAWKILVKRAYSEGKDGNYQFYKDIMDRYYGKAVENMDITSGGNTILKELVITIQK